MSNEMIIFDLDGTLIDSIEGISYSMNKVLEESGYPTHNNDKYKSFVGNGRSELVKKSLPEEIKKSNMLPYYISKYNDYYSKYWNYKMTPYSGIIELINSLTENGISVSVNTNKDSTTANLIIKKYFPDIDFTHVIGQSLNIKKKPDPGAVNLIIEEAGISRSKCIYVGDTEVDLKTAENSGVDCICVTWGFRSKKELIDRGANKIINRPEEIINYI